MLRTRVIVVACVAACMAAALVVAVSGASGASLQRVTIFGDSQLTAVAQTNDARTMLAKGIELDLRATVCRRLVQDSCPYGGVRPPTVLDEVKDTAAPIGQTVVILVGYNDYENVFAENVGIVMRALVGRGVTRVLWLTLTERRADWARMNDTLRAVAKSWSQLEVLDWKDAADASWFRGEDIHLTPAGAMGLASYIHVALFNRGIAAPTPSPPAQVPLRITVRGAGAVVLGSVRCRASCSRLVDVGSVVKLAARAPAGSVFARWSGACTGTRKTCTLKISRGASVVARFRARAG